MSDRIISIQPSPASIVTPASAQLLWARSFLYVPLGPPLLLVLRFLRKLIRQCGRSTHELTPRRATIMPLPVPKAELIGTCLEMIGYGAYLVVFFECMRVLYSRFTRNGSSAIYLWAVAMIIFSLCTVHLVVDIVRVMAAFTDHMDIPNAPAKYYGDVNSPLDVTKTAVYCTVTLISDALIVYRLFVVWSHNYWVTVIPSLAFFADIGTSAWFIWSLHEVKDGDNVLIANVTVRAKYFYTVTLILNVICTFGISYRIWMIQRSVNGFTTGGSRMTRLISVVIESAAVYSAWLIALIITSVVGEAALFILLNSISPVIGMVFSAVIIRASQDRTNRSVTSNPASGSGHGFTKPRRTGYGSGHPVMSNGSGAGIASHLRSGGVQITLDTVTHKDTSEFEMDNIETGSSPYDHAKGEALA